MEFLKPLITPSFLGASSQEKVKEISIDCLERLEDQKDKSSSDQINLKIDDISSEVNLKKDQNLEKLIQNEATEKVKCSNSKLNDAEKSNSNFESQNSNKSTIIDTIATEKIETNKVEAGITPKADCIKTNKIENFHGDEEKVNTQLAPKVSILPGSSETKQIVLNLKNYNENSENEIEKPSGSKSAVDSQDACFKNETDVENRIPNLNFTETEDSQDKTAILDDDDNSTNMSDGSLIGVIKKDTTDKTDKENDEELFRKFSLKNAVICLKRLTVDDLSELRQPCVKLSRFDCDQILPQKRLLRKVEHKSYFGIDESSKSSNASSLSSAAQKVKLNVRHQRKRKSSSTSISSDNEEKLRPKKTARKQTARRNPQKVSPDRIKERSKRLIVTPRSASGLKVRISSAPSNRAQDMELIQISSSSSSPQIIEHSEDDLEPTAFVSTLKNDPLYEEEVAFCD